MNDATHGSPHIETLAIHADHQADPVTGAVMPPLHLSTTFERAADGSYPGGYIYSRTDNPNRAALERLLAALEGGAEAFALGSGMAAIMTVLQALDPGDHVIAPQDVYHGTARFLRETMTRWGLTVTFVDMTDPVAIAAAFQPQTRLVWIETPSNPLLKITDIAAVANLAHAHSARCVADNTWATPVLQRPLGLGADVVMHSTTKYLGGHSDVLGGALVTKTRDAFSERLRQIQQTGGAVTAPFDCWLVTRSIRSLAYRMRGHCDNAMRVAQYLAGHPRIAVTHYPGLPEHPGHTIAARQMQGGFGGMLSIQIAGDERDALAGAGRLRLFTRATSLGGPESLVEHRASVEGPETRTPRNLLRFSIGLEHPDDLIADLAQALEG
jgi:cystathionine gamma-synthase